MPSRIVPPGLPLELRGGEREIGLADELQEHADRAGADPEHACAPDELLAVELASDQFVDDVVLERAGLVPAELLDRVSWSRGPSPNSLRLRALYGGRRFWF